MWVWHKVFGSFMGYDNSWAWVLSVVFLVFTLRLILFKPFLKQMDSQLKMQAVQPEMKRLREKYKDDRQRLAEEMMKLNKESGVNPLSSCLPALVQAPVFIGLFHVLRMFQPVPEAGSETGFGFRQNVYFFGASDVQSFGLAKIFGGAPLSSSMTMPADQLLHMAGDRGTIITVGIPLTILAGFATFLTSRRSVLRQREINPEAAATPQTAIMNKLMMFVFPVFVVVGGPFFPLAILFYWLANNSWTFGQLWVAHRMQDRKKAAQALIVEEAKEAAKFSKPTPGAKPKPGAKPVAGAKARPVVQPKSRTEQPADPPTGTSLTKQPATNPDPNDGGANTTAAGGGGSAGGGAANGTASNGAAGGSAAGAGASGGASRNGGGQRPGGRSPNRPSNNRKKKPGNRR
ncbi:membrane protein insertase YidC [Nakamurella sp. YIM 132087]|uniref:Membrane protein insertase YidC n=2 Tax=Nakamurella alba TaxID=2665158 RepID=A0A7K1FLH2_9ACTN|nr:membrane protein insertase YidC [Nakamurella alba]